MARLLSEDALRLMARELGVDRIVAEQGWGAVPSRDCGRIVQLAVRVAESTLAGRDGLRTGGHNPPAPSRLP